MTRSSIYTLIEAAEEKEAKQMKAPKKLFFETPIVTVNHTKLLSCSSMREGAFLIPKLIVKHATRKG
jgi:hypothetical protein